MIKTKSRTGSILKGDKEAMLFVVAAAAAEMVVVVGMGMELEEVGEGRDKVRKRNCNPSGSWQDTVKSRNCWHTLMRRHLLQVCLN